MIWLIVLVIVLILAGGGVLGLAAVRRAAHLWGPDYLRTRRRRQGLKTPEPVHLMFCLVDHFEPDVGQADEPTQARRVQTWVEKLPEVLKNFRDADGRNPVHTMFYPVENPRREHLEALLPLAKERLVELEVHLHHDDDTAENLRSTLERAKTLFGSMGYLSHAREDAALRFGFIHGNWALDNSRPDGKWCGVNGELGVLKDAGCYADFTFPSAPSPTQTRMVNRIYYASGSPNQCRGADRGVEVQAGAQPGGELMIIQGPLCPNWKRRKLGVLPRLENGELSAVNPPTAERIALWVDQHIHVSGRPEWVFVKVYTHGAYEAAAGMLLGEPRRELHRILERDYNDGKHYVLHYVSARELYNIVKAAEAGHQGNPNDYRDFLLLPMNF